MRHGGGSLDRALNEMRDLCDLAIQMDEALDAAEEAAKPDPHLAEAAARIQKSQKKKE